MSYYVKITLCHDIPYSAKFFEGRNFRESDFWKFHLKNSLHAHNARCVSKILVEIFLRKQLKIREIREIKDSQVATYDISWQP